MANKFISRFIASRKERRTSIHLSKIKQGPQESLAEFVKRFYQKVVLILDLEDGATYISFLNSLKSGWLQLLRGRIEGDDAGRGPEEGYELHLGH